MTNTEFTKSQYTSAYPEGIGKHYWSVARNIIIKKNIDKLSLSNKQMLEIGCGRGIVLDYLLSCNYNCFGVELAEMEVPESLKERMFAGRSFEELNSSIKEKTEVVLLFDVIEHIKDESEFLNNIKKTFPNIKNIIVTVPARSELFSNYDKHYGHFRRHSAGSIEKTANESGIKLESASYFFHILYLPSRILSMLKIDRAVEVEAPKGNLASLLHKTIGLFFYLEYLVLPSKLVGTSIIATMAVEEKEE